MTCLGNHNADIEEEVSNCRGDVGYIVLDLTDIVADPSKLQQDLAAACPHMSSHFQMGREACLMVSWASLAPSFMCVGLGTELDAQLADPYLPWLESQIFPPGLVHKATVLCHSEAISRIDACPTMKGAERRSASVAQARCCSGPHSLPAMPAQFLTTAAGAYVVAWLSPRLRLLYQPCFLL